MEPVGAISVGEWNTFSGMYPTEESDFIAQFLDTCPLPNDEGLMYSIDHDTNMFFPQGSSSLSYADSYQFLASNNSLFSDDLCVVEDKNCSLNQEMMSSGSMEESGGTRPEIGKEPKMPVPETSAEDQNKNPLEDAKKRSRFPEDVQRKRNVKSKKKLSDEENSDGIHRQTSSNCCSEDYSNGSQEMSGGVTTTSISASKGAAAVNLNQNGKTRTNRGSATDSQSLYARKRRERINERLRILQNLIPNGTKVDISTMLEEAVEYVKFLQLQIKLLSSDDLWMYAPIAYNGMDIGLDLNVSAPR